MTVRRPGGTRGSFFRKFLLAAGLTAAFTVPSFAQQVETVIVTAEKKAEDLQTVPIAVTAFDAEDLAEHQIDQFKDLQFDTPNVTYTKTEFASSNFSIRGIGTQVISGDAESGVAFNIDDIFYLNPTVDSSEFYDLQDVEILRGPQSTLYGRGATGGAVNVATAKPQLDDFASDAEAKFGNYDATQFEGMVNVPIVSDKFAVRFAGDWVRHDGTTTNIFPGAADPHADSLDIWSARGSARWQPDENTTVDFILSHEDEDDTRLRAQKQLCATDPTGVLGCLPNQLAAEPVNLNATFFNIPISNQAAAGAFGVNNPPLGPALAPFLAPYTPPALGVFNLANPYSAPAGAVPQGARTINSDVMPVHKNWANNVTLEWKQRIAGWLDATLVGGYADSSIFSQEGYTNAPGTSFDPAALATSEAAFQNTLNNYAAVGLVPASFANPTTGPYAFLLNPSHAGTLPSSNFTNLGIIGGSIEGYSGREYVYDQSNEYNGQKSLELRFASDLPGKVNFLAALYYLNATLSDDYFVDSNTLDYGQVLLGGLFGPLAAAGGAAPAACATTGCIYGTPYYDNRTNRANVESKAVYGEVYYDAVPDTLKITIGLRGTEDLKENEGRISVLSGFIPIGSTDQNAALAACTAQGQPGCDFDAATPGSQVWEETKRKFDKLTGRFVVDYTPKLDFTDATMIYASYARGYKAGGSNPGVQTGNLAGIPPTYEPESIDAYEIGTKNLLLDNAVQANLTAWYYNYARYQISSIIANTSVNTNINAYLSGIESEFRWAASDQLQFNFNADLTNSQIGQSAQIDTRNPSGGDADALLVKDATLSTTDAGNCVLYHNGAGATAANFDSDFETLSTFTGGLFFAPPGSGTSSQNLHQLAGAGVANAAFGTCNAATLAIVAPALAAAHFTLVDAATGGTLTGVPVNIHGNQLANTPPAALSFGVQYTEPLDGGYHIVTRFDYYWQARMWGRIFNDPADRISAYGIANARIVLDAPDDAWSAEAYVKNMFNTVGITGEYLASSTSGLYTSVFYTDPRIFGFGVSGRF